ncbi:MAG: ATP-binding protein [Hungatella sp.]|nr:ATP-binding protein [Hungatella sp.]
MRTVTFVIGATASGKTYFINTNYSDKDVDILNVYDYQQRAYEEAGFGSSIPFGASFRCLLKAQDMLLEDIIKKLQAGRDVVVEQTFFKAKRRIAYIEKIRETAQVFIETYVMCPSDSRWKSNLESRKLEGRYESFKRAREEMEFPNPAEGIDQIYEVADGVVTLRMDPPSPETVEKAKEELAREAERIQAEDEAVRKRKELIESMKVRPFWHYCEVCGRKEFITAKDAFDTGWDYPPQMGYFGLLSPRTCGNCTIKDTLYMKINSPGRFPVVIESELTPAELITWRRIKSEPESLLVDETAQRR